ncbi:MAG: hypothetical protein G01um101449_175 [Parcubacteria group bacterium Gr01-1014_49]|nr:MAG: hypothetical protein G01um101449_175 [Parcubacteria group bacterium Gr01-1014_49]
MTHFLLRASIAFAFLYPPINALFDPYTWLGYFPKFMHGILPDAFLLHGFGAIEVALALWILSGKNIFIPSVAATLMLLAIVLFNLQDFQIVFRDLSLAAVSAALALDAYRRRDDAVY